MKFSAAMLMGLLSVNVLFAAADFIVVGDGQRAVVEAPAEEYLPRVKEFIRILGEVTQVELPVVAPEDAGTENRIVFDIREVGDPKLLDNFTFSFPDDRTMRIGCSPVSLQWALNRILEDYADVRFLMPEECGVSAPARESVCIPRQERVYSPSFFSRSIYYGTDAWHRNQNFADGLHFNHEIYSRVFPVDKYAGSGYPAAILPQHKGVRLTELPNPKKPAQFWQPCYSNPETARLAAENILEFLRADPSTTSVSLTINDNGGFCECDSCVEANGGVKNYNHSEVYFQWVNRVAELVTAEFPEVLLPALAYAEVLPVPSFAIHKNVPIIICLDLYAATDSAVMAKNKALIHDWSEKASCLGTWDYAWGYFYALPRIYLGIQTEMMRYLYEHGARIYFLEYECMDGREGPKPYLYAKLLWDIDADADAVVKEWYERCVGPAAAPYLQQYYEKWEAYFAGEEIRKTPWFGSAHYVYMTWGATNHQYALRPGELAAFRELMEKTVELAGTPDEKERAAVLMRRFEGVEALAVLNGAEPIPSDGVVTTAAEAVAVIENVNRAAPYIAQLQRVSEETSQEPVIGTTMYEDMLGRMLKESKDVALINQLCLASLFAKEPEVRECYRRVAANTDLPENIATTARYFATAGENSGNRFPEGDFEGDDAPTLLELHGNGKASGRVVRENADTDNRVLEVTPESLTQLTRVLRVEPNSYYLVTFQLFIPVCGSEAYMKSTIFAGQDGAVFEWWEVAKTFVPAGQWVRFAQFGQTYESGNELHLTIDLGHFNPGETVKLDNLTLFRVGDIKQPIP